MDDPILVKEYNPVRYLACVVTDDILPKIAKIMQQLIQTSTCKSHDSHMITTRPHPPLTCHPFDEDVDVSFVLSGPQATHDVGVRDTAQH